MFSDVTTAPDGTVYGVQRPAANRLVFGRVLPSGFAPSTQVELATSHIVYPRIAMGGPGAVVCVCVTGHDDHARLVTSAGLQRDLGVVASGGQPVAIRSGMFGGVEVAIVLTPGGSRYDTLGIDTGLAFATPSIDGPFGVPLPDGGTAGGFLDWVDVLVWTDPNRIQIVGGRKLVYSMRRGDWTVGQDGDGPNRLLAYHHPTGAWFVVPGWSQYPPRIAARPDGSCVVAVSSGVGEFVESARFLPLTADADEPAGVVGSFELSPRPVRVQVFGGAGFRMNCGPQHDDLSVPHTGVFCTLGPDDVAKKVADARGLGVPLFAYVDDVSYPPEWVPVVDRLEVVPTVQAYPHRPHKSGPMQALAETVDAIEDTIAELRKHWARVAVVMAFYRQIDGAGRYNWPLQHVLDLQREAWRLVCRYGIADVLIFHENRALGKDGIVSRPEFREAERRIKAAAVGRAPAPAPSPQPVPTPAPTSRFPRARSLSHA